MKNKIIVRLRGGLGNQLFQYAFAKRLSLFNNCELVVDHLSGFQRDYKYSRSYALSRFALSSRLASKHEMFFPFERIRRGFAKFFGVNNIPFFCDYLVETEESSNFDPFDFKTKKSMSIIDGYWQSLHYFTDVEQCIRDEYLISPPADAVNLNAASIIDSSNSIAIHVRWFTDNNNLLDYYKNAIALIHTNFSNNTLFIVFSDDPLRSKSFLGLFDNVIYVDWNNDYGGEVNDLWLMTRCKHFIIADSTLSWWGAWLSASDGLRIYPLPNNYLSNNSWSSKLFPNSWIGL